MMLGARTAAWAKIGGWVNPYVTDGLMLGFVVVNGELIDSSELNGGISISGDYEIIGNRFYAKEDTVVSCVDTSQFVNYVLDVFDNEKLNEITIETVFDYSDFDWTKDTKVCEISIGGDVTNSISVGNWMVGGSVRKLYYNSFFFASGNYYHGLYNAKGEICKTTVRNRITSIAPYAVFTGDDEVIHNGTKKTGTVNNAKANWATSRFKIGGDLRYFITRNPFVSSTVLKGASLYRVSVYNRMLTDAELAANYAVDKARFNLS